MNKLKIKLSKNNFRLSIAIKDKIIFEHFLYECEIEFYSELSHDAFEEHFKYYFINSNREDVNKICINEKIKWLEG